MENAHALKTEKVLAAFGTDAEYGLTEDEASVRLQKFGRNELPAEKKPSVWWALVKQFHSGLTYILFVAALLSLYVGQVKDAVGIFLVVLIDVIFSFVQERRAETAIGRLKDMVVHETSVIRGGGTHRLAAWQLVPGDIILVREGDKIAADARLLSCKDLRANEAPLTGESLPAVKSPEPVAGSVLPPERKNMIWAGTTVIAGTGKAVVTETGIRTNFGKIAASLSAIRRPRAPFESRIDRLGWQLGVCSLVLAAVVLLIGRIKGFALVDLFFFTIALAVSVIPEGLPSVLAVVLAIGVQRMARKNAIIRHVPSVETLGLADVICTDKTGTLTENKMTVREVALFDRDIGVSGEGWEPKGDFLIDGRPMLPAQIPELSWLLKAAAVNTDASLEMREGRADILGDPTEGAMVVLAAKAGLDKRRLESEFKQLDEMPFSSNRRYRAVLGEQTDLNGRKSAMMFVTGAYDALVVDSDGIMVNGKRLPLDEESLGRFNRANERLAERAMRVLAVACKSMPLDKRSIGEEDVSGLTLLGLVGMIDPPRAGVTEALARCRRAGVRVIMVTGDHKVTAVAIAKEIGLLPSGRKTEGVYAEAEIVDLVEEEFLKRLRQAVVFARISPMTKLRIVSGLQKLGFTVAMTGDGVNDAPALKQAAIGVSMGITGTDVSKEVADMVLADDNFITIVSAIEEGRVIFRNVKQTTAYLFTTNMAEAVTVIVSILAGLPLPLLPAQILWMNLVTDGFPDIALATEPADEQVLAEPPRRRNAHFITGGTLIMTAITSVLMCAGTLLLFSRALGTGDQQYARTVAFTAMAVFQLWNVLNMRSATVSIFKLGLRSNVFVLVAIVLSLGLQLAVLHLPFLRSTFRTQVLGLQDWGLIILVTSSILVSGEIYKFFCRRGFIPRSWL